jgi:hypothetical protein
MADWAKAKNGHEDGEHPSTFLAKRHLAGLTLDGKSKHFLSETSNQGTLTEGKAWYV